MSVTSALCADHEQALRYVERVEQGLAGGRGVLGAVQAFLSAWQDVVAPHLEEEETVLVTFLESLPQRPQTHLDRLRSDHGWLREHVDQLARRLDDEAAWPHLAAKVAGRLRDHLRFEEQELFAWVDSNVDAEGQEELARRQRDYRWMQGQPTGSHRA